MLPTKFKWVCGLVLIIALMFLFPSPAFANPNHSVLGLELSFEATNPSYQRISPVESIKSMTDVNFFYDLSKNLNQDRDEIGRNIFSVIHPNGSYDYTEPILMAEKPGNRVVFEIPIHWHRDLTAIQRNHLTRLRWEIANHQHLKAEVIYDNSTFAPTHLNEMNDSLRLLLNGY